MWCNGESYKVLDGVFSWNLHESVNGCYYRNTELFFALYKSDDGPQMYYDGKVYSLHQNLTIGVEKQEKMRHFSIKEYGIEIDYPTSEYIDWDPFSIEEDVDIFVLIANNYRKTEFYEQYTLY